jgi:glycosyltransferase involved in cell wall biosynthesis
VPRGVDGITRYEYQREMDICKPHVFARLATLTCVDVTVRLRMRDWPWRAAIVNGFAAAIVSRKIPSECPNLMEHKGRRPKVLVFVSWYAPGFKGGGAMRAAAEVVKALRDEFDFSIVTSDTDASERKPYAGVRSDAWTTLPDGTSVFYCSRSGLAKAALERVMREVSPDAVFISGLFSYPFAAVPLRLARKLASRPPVLIAPRGMLAPAALATKAIKKKAFIATLKIAGLFDGITWLAVSPQEADDVRAVIGEDASVEVAMDLPRPTLKHLAAHDKRPGEVRLCFVARIVRNKNLLEAIRLVKRVGPSYKVHLDIFGPAEDERYWRECYLEMHQLPKHVSIEYRGAVEHERIGEHLALSHFLLLPTRFESFGYVIIESLAAGRPVIISDKTPWRGLRQRRIGWDLPLSEPEGFVGAIEEAAAMDAEAFTEWSEAAYSFFMQFLEESTAQDSRRAIFWSLIQEPRVG